MLAGFDDEMVHKVNGVPDKQQRDERDKVGDKDGDVRNRCAVFFYAQPEELLIGRYDAGNKKRKCDSKKKERKYLLAQFFHQHRGAVDDLPHEMGKDDAYLGKKQDALQHFWVDSQLKAVVQ